MELKAKRIDNNDWVTGELIQKEIGNDIISFIKVNDKEFKVDGDTLTTVKKHCGNCSCGS